MLREFDFPSENPNTYLMLVLEVEVSMFGSMEIKSIFFFNSV